MKCWCGGKPRYRYSYLGVVGADTKRELRQQALMMGLPIYDAEWWREMVDDHKECKEDGNV